MMQNNLNRLLDRCLQTKSPGKAMVVASLGCLLGSFLVILAIQIYSDSKSLLPNESSSFVSLSKKVKGGLMINLSEKGKTFSPEEVMKIKEIPGVIDIAGFSRNHFPLSINIWPTGKIGLGSAARADLFFESIPDRFIDQQSEDWKWDQNKSFVPIIVPKFYLDLWNFGLAPSRAEYPSLSNEAASSMPIEIFIGEDQKVRMIGRFIAFSKRINSVLVPQNFLQWANARFGEYNQEKYFFLWKNESIHGPPVSLSELKNIKEENRSEIIISEIDKPAVQISLSSLLEKQPDQTGPSRLIAKLENSAATPFFEVIEPLGYETSKEYIQADWINRVTDLLIWAVAGLGALFSFFSITTFTSCFRLMVVQSSQTSRDLVQLGFSLTQVSGIFTKRFVRIFLLIWISAIFAVSLCKSYFVKLALAHGSELASGLGWETWAGAILYALLFSSINHLVIQNTIKSCCFEKYD